MDASQGSSAARIFPMPQTIPAPPLASSAAALPSSSLYLSSYSSSRHAPSITSFPILVLTVLGILAASLLLVAYYVFVIRCCLTWHRGSSDVAGLIVSRRARTNTSGSIQASGGAAPADAEPRGLDDDAIRTLPAFGYKKKLANAAETSAPASECAVCLGEFEEGDRVRMLPACLHVFHLACVDAWLQGSTSCPLCRADVAAATLFPPPSPEEEEVVAIQVVVVPGGAGAEEDDQGTLPRRQREAIVATAPAEDHQVGGGKTKTATDGCHGMTERRNDGDRCSSTEDDDVRLH